MGRGSLRYPLIPANWAYYEGIQNFDYDPQQAATLLDGAGYTLNSTESGAREDNGTALKFEMVYPDDATHAAIAQAIQADWEKIGVQVTLIPVQYDVLVLDYLEPLTYQAALIDLNFERSPDPDPYPFWDQAQQSGGQNYSQWENKVISEYLEEARVSTDLDERAKLYRNFQVVFQDELPALPLYYPVYNFAVGNSINGVRLGSFYDTSDRFYSVLNWYLISQASEK
jgi:peptide/nickel transport system substrate-binding protein